VVEQAISQHEFAEGSADDSNHHRLSQSWAPFSQNQMCENLWTLPRSRFRSPQKLVSYFGLNPRIRQSGLGRVLN
jgi:hypothetical protein